MKRYFFIAFCACTVISCKKDKVAVDDQTPVIPNQITGFIQKGPFVAGSSLSLYELDNQLAQTGRVFNTQTTDDKGSFTVNTAGLNQYSILKADGYYYNEDQSFISSSQLTLYNICDLTDATTNINVNVLTHLIKPRFEYLVQSGSTFHNAKIQAQSELLHVFGFTKPGIRPFENLDITQSGDDNAILLAISLILQGTNYSMPYGNFDGAFSERLTVIANDIKTDGVLNNDELLYYLLNNSVLIDESTVRSNLISKYGSLGTTVASLDIRKYIDSFIVHTSVQLDGNAMYFPDKIYDENYNILRLASSNFTNTSAPVVSTLLMNAYVPLNSTLTIKVEEMDSTTNPAAKISNIYNVKSSSYIDHTFTHSKTISLDPLTTLYHIDLMRGYSYKLKYYENGSTIPSIERTINVSN